MMDDVWRGRLLVIRYYCAHGRDTRRPQGIFRGSGRWPEHWFSRGSTALHYVLCRLAFLQPPPTIYITTSLSTSPSTCSMRKLAAVVQPLSLVVCLHKLPRTATNLSTGERPQGIRKEARPLRRSARLQQHRTSQQAEELSPHTAIPTSPRQYISSIA